MSAVLATGVVRRFPGITALDGVDLAVEAGEIFGVLGPNGSGKTTLFNCLEGLDRPTEGSVEVLGLDPVADREALTLRIGVQLQSAAVLPRLRVREVLELYAALYPNAGDPDATLANLGLTSKAGDRLERLSGGQRQRVFIALALLHDPELLFFDELTSAVDPQARLAIWDILRGLREKGHTIVLTSHSMEEAQALCDRIAVLDAGRVIAQGTPAELILRHGGPHRLTATVTPEPDPESLTGIQGITSITVRGGALEVEGTGDFAPAVLAALSAAGLAVTDLALREPTLEDVFVALTGRAMKEE